MQPRPLSSRCGCALLLHAVIAGLPTGPGDHLISAALANTASAGQHRNWLDCRHQRLRGAGPGDEESLATLCPSVADFVASADLPPAEESDTSGSICERVILPQQEQDVAVRPDDSAGQVIEYADICPPPRTRHKVSWQETQDLSVYESMLKDSPQNADVWSAYGHALLAGHNDASRALAAYGRAVELVPSHAFALNNLGFILMKYRNDLPMAEGCFRKALAVEPSDVNANVNLAVLLSTYRHPPDFSSAEDCYQRALAVDDTHLGVLVNYANLLVERPLPELDAHAASEARKRVLSNPDGPGVDDNDDVRNRAEDQGVCTWRELVRPRATAEDEAVESGLTQTMSKVQDWEQAGQLYERALELEPGSADAMCGYASLRRHQNDFEGAEALYVKAVAAGPAHHETRSERQQSKCQGLEARNRGRGSAGWASLGRCAHDSLTHSFTHALTPLTTSLTLTCTHICRAQYGLLLHKQGELERALRQYRQALAIAPSDTATIMHAASLLQATKAPTEDVVGLYQRALQLLPEAAEVYHHMGRVLQASGALEPAKAMFECALVHRPRDVYSLNSLALILQHQGSVAEAQMLLVRALALAPDEHALHSNYAALLQQERHEYDAAEEHYCTALALKPDHLQTLCCYGSFLRTVRQDWDEALRLLRQALVLAPDMPEVRRAMAAAEVDARQSSASAALASTAS